MTREQGKGGNVFGTALMTPIGILYLFFLIIPIGFFLSLSFLTYSAEEMYVARPTLENYGRLVLDGYYRGIIFDTIRVSLIVTLITLVLGYVLALFLSRMKSAWRGIMMFLIIAPLMTGVIVRTYGWIVLLGTDGLVNMLLVGSGIVERPLQMLNNERTAIVALVHIMLPYMVFPIFSSLVAQDPHLVPAAGTLGARPLRTFLEITLPLSRPGIVMASVIVFTMTSGSIVTVDLLAGRDLTIMGQVIYQLIMSTFNWPLAAAVAALLVLCQFALISYYFRKTRRGY
ncbi:ABC transporter permease [Mesorhizobium australicum]|uniref:Spermidine/putrescine transport system permease protein n=1 Tax=Mesorhizobium australicum TaxID=536018 RepID=A0A1X7NFY7_9HYPH|nr:ABC transporter permease [Mesorhizobium australicum]SMH36628.1 spermidine/putrescine transport system permease protein [Mesorhizobium australicum]